MKAFGAQETLTLDCVVSLLNDTFEDGQDISELDEDKNLVKACFKVLQSLLESSASEKGSRKFKVEPTFILLPNQLWILRPLHKMTFIGKPPQNQVISMQAFVDVEILCRLYT